MLLTIQRRCVWCRHPLDLVVGSDVIYDGHGHAPLCALLSAVLAKAPACRVVLATMPRFRVAIDNRHHQRQERHSGAGPSRGAPSTSQHGTRSSSQQQQQQQQEEQQRYSDEALVHFAGVAEEHGLAVVPVDTAEPTAEPCLSSLSSEAGGGVGTDCASPGEVDAAGQARGAVLPRGLTWNAAAWAELPPFLFEVRARARRDAHKNAENQM
jgi:hypothetical protein